MPEYVYTKPVEFVTKPKKFDKKLIIIPIIIIVLAFYFYFSNETAFSYFKSCDELQGIKNNLEDKLSRDCNVDDDCVERGAFPCGEMCISKNADLRSYDSLSDEIDSKCFHGASVACEVVVRLGKCRCVLNTTLNKSFCRVA